MPRHQQVVRQWQLLRRIEHSPHGISIAEVAGNDSARQRAVYRDLEALQQAGFPLYACEANGQRRWMVTDAHRKGRSVPLTLGEILALRSARSAIAHFSASPINADLHSIIEKLDSSLSPTLRSFAAEMDQVFVGDRFGSPDYAHLQPLVSALTTGRQESRSVDVDYCSQSGGETKRRLDPYNIWLHRGQPYLVAWCHHRQAVRTFSLARMKHAVLTETAFTVCDDYSFSSFAGPGFRIMREGRVTAVDIWFAAEVALYVRERTWHASQHLQDAAGGAVILHLEVDGLSELTKWVLSFGRNARVLRPQHLADAVRDELHAALRGYDQKIDNATMVANDAHKQTATVSPKKSTQHKERPNAFDPGCHKTVLK